ncbi:MAG: DegT/DnrJ/EryC1/StrS family aminotransferase [Nanoarchaeota archaeon]|nr:DegT/DnrJ/EryC1/StrS family aminotransferase [Nanoarchaeota archaeon]MBU1005811.1 DegT/DnrJ/EryC1/StrS family aminotransferase [Nanoarchaeota archaeon]MBU1946470.1 DegT/DnrJ/EryC1/StrS family aminotransferase [Nanoarchaeota archaeon]
MENEIKEILKRHTSHYYISLTPRGNTSILISFLCAKKIKRGNILTTDQGGWISYLKYPKKIGLEVKLCKTDNALIGLNDLKEKSKGCSAFIYAQPGGYFVEQSIKEIYEICKKNNCLTIMDITGSIGTDLCNGKYADIIICSFGDYKPINVGYGGFISTDKKEYFNLISNMPEADEFKKSRLKDLLEKLDNLKQRHETFSKANKKIKEDLKKFNIIHKGKKGINVLIKFKNEKEKKEILDYCEKNSFKYKLCRKVLDSTKDLFSFIKVNEDAVSIEVQRL